MTKKIYDYKLNGVDLSVETGELAKQANASVLIRYGDTVVLTSVVMGKNAVSQDFFPLTVLYQEKLYSVGKIPGGFIKREGRPSEQATLTARLIDRPIRPMFNENFRNEVQVINTVLSVDPDNSPEMAALFGSSLALGISDIPFDGPVAGVIVGKIGDKYLINPNAEETEQSKLLVTVAGTKDAICMVEAGAKEASEKEMLEALDLGEKEIKKLCEFQESIIKEIGKEKVKVDLATIDPELEDLVRKYATDKIFECFSVTGKQAQYEALDNVKINTIGYFTTLYKDNPDLDNILDTVGKLVYRIEGECVRELITKYKKRPDGRKLDEIRPLSAKIDILPRTHGSALFTRGETQALSTTTLGAIGEHQILDGLGLEDTKRFMLHYNFPAFCVGEVGRYGSPGRREIGHGALGERALLQVMPSEEEFAYTVRVVSGLEDHMGDMDFKVAGTKKGITALQMDIKIKGVTEEILKKALQQAKKARLQVLDVMAGAIKEPRKELSKYAPKIATFTINPDKIKDVIGKGGDMITKIILEASNVKSVNDKDAVKVDLEDDGRVIIYHQNQEIIDKTRKMIEEVVREVETGKIYVGKIVKVENFGCFVELWPGCEGLCHVSQLDIKRVEDPHDSYKKGDEIIVKALGYDNKGRLNLSRKDVLKEQEIKQKKD